MLEVKNISKNFGEKVAVDNLSFTLKEGEMLGLLGANGAGKTTTFRMIMGVFAPTDGNILFNDKKININNSSQIGFLAEERALLNKFTIANQLKFFAELKGMNVNEIDKEIDYWLDFFELNAYKNKKIKELSKGNQQKIQFVSAVIHKPTLLILDEPFSGLDPFNVNLFKNVILDLKSKGTAIIFSSHRLDHVEQFCEDIIVLIDGKAHLSGNINEIKKHANSYNISIQGDFDMSIFENKSFISSTKKIKNRTIVSISNYANVKDVFNLVSEYNIEHFAVDLPSLEEIFVKEVGKSYNS